MAISTTDNQYECSDQMVSHPPHYQTKSGLETISVIEAFTEGLDGIEAVCTANIIKYACRWKRKNGEQDLRKILWYTTYLINHINQKQSSQTTNHINQNHETQSKEDEA